MPIFSLVAQHAPLFAILLAQTTLPTDPTSINEVLQVVVGYPLLGLFVWLYVRAQNQLVTVQREAAQAQVAAQVKASEQVAAIYKQVADERRADAEKMSALLFDLARRGVRPDPTDTQPIPRAEMQAALASERAKIVQQNTPGAATPGVIRDLGMWNSTAT